MRTISSLADYFEEEMKQLRCGEETRAYIVGVLSKYRFANDDLSKKSITIEFGLAKWNNDFERFQRIGDYLFFANSFCRESLNGASKEYYYSLAQLSYFSCFRTIKWRSFEEIADRFVDLSDGTRKIIHKL